MEEINFEIYSLKLTIKILEIIFEDDLLKKFSKHSGPCTVAGCFSILIHNLHALYYEEKER